MASEPLYPVSVQLVGTDGNALALIGTVTRALRSHGVSPDKVKEFHNEATSGDYDNVIATCCRWVDVS